METEFKDVGVRNFIKIIFGILGLVGLILIGNSILNTIRANDAEFRQACYNQVRYGGPVSDECREIGYEI
jgi:hypothetical protein